MLVQSGELMKIVEITEAFSLGTFARGVGQDLMSMWTGVDKPGGKGWFEKSQAAPPQDNSPERIRRAKEIAKLWDKRVIQIKARSRDTSSGTSGATGVNDFTKIDRRQLSMEANMMVSQILNQLTQGKVPNISKISALKSAPAITPGTTSTKIDPAKFNANVDRIEAKIRTALNGLMVADPSEPAGAGQVLRHWQDIINSAYLVNQLMAQPDAEVYGLAGRKIDRVTSGPDKGAIRLDGRILNPDVPADAQIINDIMTQGLNPPGGLPPS